MNILAYEITRPSHEGLYFHFELPDVVLIFDEIAGSVRIYERVEELDKQSYLVVYDSLIANDNSQLSEHEYRTSYGVIKVIDNNNDHVIINDDIYTHEALIGMADYLLERNRKMGHGHSRFATT